ncbi:MAG: EamA family transporter [Desulfovibrio sp.]|nr:EamA family transporter [Desulfovibrio sp.]
MSKHLLLMLLTVLCNVSANLFLKAGSSGQPASFLGFLNLKICLGLFMFAVGALFYIAALRIGSLSVSQAIVSLQYVGVLIGAYVIFHEQLTPFQILGCVLVGLGMLMVTRG